MSRIVFRIRDPDALVFKVGETEQLQMGLGDPVIMSDIYPEYEGPYEVTPGPEAQVLQTRNRTLSQVITVGPIPKNYGLITYNGRTITVS